MKLKLHYLILCFLPTLFYSQNLITNGGFESYTQLPSSTGQYYRCNGWSNCNGEGSPDYFHINGTGLVKLPNTFASTINPQEGSAVMGMGLYHSSTPNFREYLTTTLANPLVIGQNYQLSFYISNGMAPIIYGGLATDHFSVALSTYSLVQNDSYHSITSVTPQYTYNGFLYSNDWQLVTYLFVADQAYQYITFGSFVADSGQLLQQFDTATNTAIAYYYIDNVNLSTPLSIEEQEATATIKVYHDRTNETLTIEIQNDNSSDLKIYDINGRLLVQKTFNNNLTINTSLFYKGIYIYHIIDDTGKHKQGKILIQ
jgi:hypothetical protein